MSEAEQEGQLHPQPVGPRAAVVAAGPIANFILAIVIFAAIFMIFGKQTTSARVDTVQPDSAAAAAGFQPGDLVVSIDGSKIDSFADMQRIVSISAGEPLDIEVERGGVRDHAQGDAAADARSRTISATCTGSACSASAARWRRATSRPSKSVRSRRSWLGAQETWFVVDRTLSYIGGVFAGREAADQLGGPIRIAQVSGQVATAGFVAAHSPGGGVVGLDRAVEPVPDPAARRRSPFVLSESRRCAAARCPSAPRKSGSGSGWRSSSC